MWHTPNGPCAADRPKRQQWQIRHCRRTQGPCISHLLPELKENEAPTQQGHVGLPHPIIKQCNVLQSFPKQPQDTRASGYHCRCCARYDIRHPPGGTRIPPFQPSACCLASAATCCCCCVPQLPLSPLLVTSFIKLNTSIAYHKGTSSCATTKCPRPRAETRRSLDRVHCRLSTATHITVTMMGTCWHSKFAAFC